VFWILFLAGFLPGFWQAVTIRHGWPGLVVLAGTLYGCILFAVGGVWGLIAPACCQRIIVEIRNQNDVDSPEAASPASKVDPGAN
jgi:hypothetical protein